MVTEQNKQSLKHTRISYLSRLHSFSTSKRFPGIEGSSEKDKQHAIAILGCPHHKMNSRTNLKHLQITPALHYSELQRCDYVELNLWAHLGSRCPPWSPSCWASSPLTTSTVVCFSLLINSLMISFGIPKLCMQMMDILMFAIAGLHYGLLQSHVKEECIWKIRKAGHTLLSATTLTS